MNISKKLLKMLTLSVLIALGVVISPILRVEGMCPMAHLINIVCSVLLGPMYSLLCATLIGIIRMILMGIPPLALTGAIFGAFFSGLFYRLGKGKILYAVFGEILGTGIIGAITSYPVMTFLWNKEGLSLLFYVPSFICGTLIGGSIAYLLLRKLSNSGLLPAIQEKLGSRIFEDKPSKLENSLGILALGGISWLVCSILKTMFSLNTKIIDFISYGAIIIFTIFAVLYYISEKEA